MEAARVEIHARFDSTLISAKEITAKLREHVKQLFEKQGIEWEDISAEEAAQRVGPGGYWSPEATAKRIVDFVEGFANGDPEREKLLRGAVEEGYKQAEAAWGEKLPDISRETIKLVREGLDALFAKPEEPPKEPAKEQPRKVDALV